MMDIVLPKKNETELIAMASKLGWKSLCFAYKENEYRQIDRKKLEDTGRKQVINVHFSAIVTAVSSHGQAFPGLPLIILHSPPDPRLAFERHDIDAIIGLENSTQRDSSHSRNSGMNHVTAQLARTNGISIIFSLNDFLRAGRMQRTHIKGRISQNIILCRKYGIPCIIGSFAEKPLGMRSAHDMASLFMTFGMTAGQAKIALEQGETILHEKARKTAPGYVSRDIEMM